MLHDRLPSGTSVAEKSHWEGSPMQRIHPSCTIVSLGLALASLTASSAASAQSLDPRAAQTNYGVQVVGPALVSDPMQVDVVSGGNRGAEVSVQPLGLGANCVGFTTANPDLRVTVSAPLSFLRVFVDAGTNDTTLVVARPDGTWTCNDDAEAQQLGTNPSVDLVNVIAGDYAIWVGSYQAGVNARAKLFLTTRRDLLPPHNAASTGNTVATTPSRPTACGAGATRAPRSIEAVADRHMSRTDLGRIYSNDFVALTGARSFLAHQDSEVVATASSGFDSRIKWWRTTAEVMASAAGWGITGELNRSSSTMLAAAVVVTTEREERWEGAEYPFDEDSLPTQARYFLSAISYGRRFDRVLAGSETEINGSLSAGLGPFSGSIAATRTAGHALEIVVMQGYVPITGATLPERVSANDLGQYYREQGPVQPVVATYTEIPDCARGGRSTARYRVSVREVTFPPQRTHGPWDQGMFEGASPEISVVPHQQADSGAVAQLPTRIARPGTTATWPGESYVLGTLSLTPTNPLIVELRDDDGGGRFDPAGQYSISSPGEGERIGTEAGGELRRFSGSNGTTLELLFIEAEGN